MKKSFWFFLILTIAVMVWIFGFSQQNADSSTKASDTIVDKIVNEKTFDDGGKKTYETARYEASLVIRKTAHFCIYTLLGLFVFMTLYYSEKMHRNYILFIFSMIICIIYATSDEVHQLFMDGRSGQFTDILIDGCGSFVGCVIAFLIQKIRKKVIFFIRIPK